MFSQIWELSEISYTKENIVFLLKTIQYIPATGYSFH